VFDTFRSAIALESVDGGLLENIDIRGVQAVNTGNAIFIRLGHRNNDDVYSVVRNIYISDVDVEVPADKPDKGYEMEGPLLRFPPGRKPEPGMITSVSPWNFSYKDPEAVVYTHNVFPSSITGLPGHPVENVIIENLRIRYAGGGEPSVNYMPLDSLHMITEAVTNYPEFSMFGELPAWGFYIRHVKGVQLKNINLVQQKKDYRAGMVINQSADIDLDNLSFSGPVNRPVVFVNASENIRVGKMKVRAKRKNAIKIQNAEKRTGR
jgi:hypothetical protein